MKEYTLLCIGKPAEHLHLCFGFTIGKEYKAIAKFDDEPTHVVATEDNGCPHSFNLPGSPKAHKGNWNTNDYFRVVEDGKPVELKLDVADRALSIGDKVAFCMAGRSGDMRVGTIVEMKPKTAVVKHKTFVEKHIGGKWQYVDADATCSRNYENLCRIN